MNPETAVCDWDYSYLTSTQRVIDILALAHSLAHSGSLSSGHWLRTAGTGTKPLIAVIAVTALEAIPADVSIRDLEARWGISRNALKARAKALGVELVRVSSTHTVWPGAFIEIGEQLHHHLQSGRPMSEFGGVAPISDGSAIPGGGPEDAQTLSVLAGLAMGPTGAEDLLRRPHGLQRASQGKLLLTAAELKALGVKGVIDSKRDTVDRYGYRFQRHQPDGRGTERLWSVHKRHIQLTSPEPVTGSHPASKPRSDRTPHH